jgi:diguanylate cyclase (GGDEF)-like protein
VPTICKEINDSYGHDAGDIVLRELSKQLKYFVRTDDIVCRLGGDEFLIICPRTDKEGLLYIAEWMHAQIAELTIPVPGGAWRGSISVGIAVKTSAMKEPEELIKAADNGVYAAKKAGKNCVKLGI